MGRRRLGALCLQASLGLGLPGAEGQMTPLHR
jgi:hypothetical protein